MQSYRTADPPWQCTR